MAEKTVEFQYTDSRVRSVSIAGSFNQWDPKALKLIKDAGGNWKGSLKLRPGRYEYRIVADGKWIDDPKAKQTVPNAFGGKNALLVIK